MLGGQMEQKKEKKQLFKSVPVEELKKIFQYCPTTGELTRLGRKLNDKLNADEGFAVWYIINKKQYKALAIEIAFAIHTGSYSSYKVRTKDLDNSNLKFNNLIPVSYDQERTICTALLNLRKYLRVKPTEFDQNRYVVVVYNQEKINRRFDTAESAAAFVRKTKLMFMKNLEKLGIDINSKYLY